MQRRQKTEHMKKYDEVLIAICLYTVCRWIIGVNQLKKKIALSQQSQARIHCVKQWPIEDGVPKSLESSSTAKSDKLSQNLKLLRLLMAQRGNEQFILLLLLYQ